MKKLQIKSLINHDFYKIVGNIKVWFFLVDNLAKQ